ncbi:MAG: 16S rRNA (guanine(966)-N(2))-methyltransferase RsmD [Lachnospiraceae bacterium]|nr:16S rRNA (guanine(966)-N(2))-methyltransferase RsmD [Lachnospiraceae bacterium]
MRVIAGSARRLKLKAPDGMDTRPTQDIIKETLFNMIQTEVPGSVFVDLCAGSGQIGIEALSRGARRAYFVENGRAAAACIQQNLHTTHFEETGVLLRQDVLSALRHIREKEADIIYMDPPYEAPAVHSILRALPTLPYFTDNTLVIVETSLETEFPELEELGLELVREKRYRTNRHLFIRKKERNIGEL